MGHSFVLKAMEQLISPSFIPTWDSMVFKFPGDGVPIKWHRDASAASVDQIPAIDVGFYLDDATLEHDSCLYAIPGSQKWPDQLASHMLQHMSADGFRKTGAVPIPVKAGDVLMHNILVLHGSPSCSAPLRRTVYFEYRDIDQELRMGPHKADYIPLKQSTLQKLTKSPRDR
jgi:phytanoyl-CoA hydroxylase